MTTWLPAYFWCFNKDNFQFLLQARWYNSILSYSYINFLHMHVIIFYHAQNTGQHWICDLTSNTTNTYVGCELCKMMYHISHWVTGLFQKNMKSPHSDSFYNRIMQKE